MDSLNRVKPDCIIIQCDGNGTCVLGDTTKQLNTLIAAVAGKIVHQWDRNQPEMSYKDYIQKIRFPGNKYLTEIKIKHEAKLSKFIHYLNKHKHPLYNEALNLYNTLAEQYLDKESNQANFNLFPSVIKLIKQANKTCNCIFILRTFGLDGPRIAKEFNNLSDAGVFGEKKVKLNRRINFTQDGIEIEKEKFAIGASLFKAMLETDAEGKDVVDPWINSGCVAINGKKIYCVEDANFENKLVVTFLLDDNFKKDENVPADPNARNIGFPVDIYGRPTSWNSKGIIGIAVDSVDAALQEDYFVNEINKELIKKGFTPLKE